VVGVGKNQSELAQLAMTRLAQDGLAPTPHNYALAFHYVAGDLPALTLAVNQAGGLTQKSADELYEKYIVTEDAVFFKHATGIIDAELKKIMGLISETNRGADQFGQDLSKFSGNLAGVDSMGALREAVAKIVVETRTITEQNLKLQDELQNTTRQLTEVRTDFDRVHKEAQVDPLTKVGNRKFFDSEIQIKMAQAKEEGTVLSLLIADIDHFKSFNDMHGHLIGDQVLRLVARTLVESLKGRDTIARYGGEEFVILLPQTKLQDAERVANALRASLATKQIRKRGSHEILGVVTVSLGAAEYRPGEDSDSLIARADAGLYKAKQTGRNKVVCEQ